MGSDYYKVDVVHYINPHLIWVVTRKHGEESNFYFEQIGLYGVLPQSVTIDVDCVLKTEVSEEWLPAAMVAMNKALHDAAEVWFSPTYIDKKSSIFDDNCHRFGDINIIKKDGRSIDLAEEVVQSGFAYTNEHLFHQKLVNNYLKTKLDYVAEHEVLKKLKVGFKTRRIPEKVWLEILRQQTTVFEEARQLEESIKNRKVVLQTLEDRDQVETVLKNKMNDLKLCKDVDEIPVGRANNIRNKRTTGETVNWSKWLQRVKENRKKNNGSQSFTSDETDVSSGSKNQNGITRFKNLNNRNFRHDHNENCRDIRNENNRNFEKPEEKEDNDRSLPNNGYRDSQESDHTNQTNARNNQNNIRNNQNDLRNNQCNYRNYQNNDCNNQSDDQNKENNNGFNQTNNRNLRNNAKITVPQSGPEEVRNVAYGPAGLTHTKFRIRPKTEVEEERRKEEETRKEDEQKNMCASTSEVKSQISNSDTLLQCQPTQNNVQISPQTENTRKNGAFEFLKRKRQFLEQTKQVNLKVSTSGDDSDDSIAELDKELRETYKINDKTSVENVEVSANVAQKNNVNPYRNLDGTISVFVDKLVTPILMVHTKKGNRIQPVTNMRDVPFGNDIHCALRDLRITKPMRTQTISWMSILRGHSYFVVAPHNSGSTMGYLPAVCRLANDFKQSQNKCELRSIIVCATSRSLNHVQNMCKLLVHGVKVFACHAGMSDMSITTSLLNGCDILICTPSMLVRLIQKDVCLDLHNISTFVIDDCEYMSKSYTKEIKYCVMKVLNIVKKRPNKEWKCQFIAVSRIWCDIMSSLAMKAPDSIVCISAFEECVLYSKAATNVEYLAEEKKLASVINFLDNIDKSKKTVIVCKADNEVKLIAEALMKLQYIVFSCDSSMTVEDLYNLDKVLKEYEEPVLGPILVCCDGNLSHLNVTDAHYLIQYSLPDLFSMFCSRFAVLNDNYSSIFNETDNKVKIKIMLDNSNIKALPKILHYVKRCMSEVPSHLDELTSKVVREKNLMLAKDLAPICKMLLTLGECSNYWNCRDRHAMFKEYDEPKEWLPKDGVINFRIIDYHSAAHYTARLLSYETRDKKTKAYPQNYSLLSLKMGLYYSKESNKRLQGILKIGDFCAVTLKQNLFVRCQIIKISNKGNNVLIKLIDEEKYKYVPDTSLYYLPEELKQIETHVVNVILANMRPEDKDVTYSDLAEKQVRKFVEENDEVFVRGQVAMVVGSNVLVETLEVCQELSSIDEVVVKHNLRQELLDGHAVTNPDHVKTLKEMCDFEVASDVIEKPVVKIPTVVTKALPKPRWAHLEGGVFSTVLFMLADSPSQFFVRLEKFDKCLTTLINDIKLYVAEKPKPKEDINIGDIVIAEHPDDSTFERARVESTVTNGKVKCFFVDQAEWWDVSINKILPITEKFITQLPFQAIECRLIGVKPFGENWSDFTTNFLTDSCFSATDKPKHLYTKYFKKEKATVTEGHKYGIVLIDTYTEEDVIINNMLIEKNLAEPNDEVELLENIDFQKNEEPVSDSDDEEPKPVVSTIDRSIFLRNSNKLPSSNDVLQYVPQPNSDEDDKFDFVTEDPKNPFNVPLSQIVQIKELPDREWTEEECAAPVTCYLPTETKDVDVKYMDEADESDMDDSDEMDDEDDISIEIDTNSNSTDSDNNEVVAKATVEEIKTDIEQVKTTVEGKTKTDEKANTAGVKADVKKTEVICKPKVLWSQTRAMVTIKVLLTVDTYVITIKDRGLSMQARANDTDYGFDVELYGVVDLKKCSHANKGQYIMVKLWKRKAMKWLSLTTDIKVQKWIAYDMETIEVSSDEEPEVVDNRDKVITHNEEDSDSDGSFHDDINFTYNYKYRSSVYP